MASYAVQLATRYDGLVIATFPDLPGVTALGADDAEALDQARHALAEALADYDAEGRTPPPPANRGTTTVEAPLIAPPIPA